MSVEGGFPHRYPWQLVTPFLATAKMQKKKWVLVFHRSLLFRPNFPKNSGRYRRPYKKMEILLAILEGFFFVLPLFCLFFVIFYPNKSYARIFRGFP